MKSDDERRIASRYSVQDAPVQGRPASNLLERLWRPCFSGRMVDLSSSGCRFLSEDGIPLRSQVDLEFTLRDDPDAVSARGTVRHRRMTQIDGRYYWDLGVRFEGMGEREAYLLRHRLATGRVGPPAERTRRRPG